MKLTLLNRNNHSQKLTLLLTQHEGWVGEREDTWKRRLFIITDMMRGRQGQTE